MLKAVESAVAVVFNMLFKSLLEQLHSYDEGRAIRVRDPHAAADGFRALCEVAFETLFGVKFCPSYPRCNVNGTSRARQDLRGSSATFEGGVFGRIDAVAASIESQISSSLHAHAHLFV